MTFESEDLGAALAAAEAAARELVDRSHWGPDIFTAAPAGARWTADELNEQLIYQQAYEPQGDVRMVIIAYAHLMDARLHDHLLKIVEEPVAPVLFMFVVDDGDRLPVTVQSRIFRRLTVEPRSAGELESAIQSSAGVAPSAAVVRLSQLSPMLSSAITGEPGAEVLTAAEEFASTLFGHGFTAGFRATKSLKTLSRAVSGGSAEAPKTKAAQRELLRSGLKLLQSTQLQVLASGDTQGAVLADRNLGRLDRAAHLSEVHLPPDQVLAYALAEVHP